MKRFRESGAWEYFGKSLSLNTVRRWIEKCNLKLYYVKRKAFINCVQKLVLWAQSHGTKYNGSMFSGQTSRQVQKPASVMVRGCISAHGMGESAYMWRYHWYGGLCWNIETYAAVKTTTFPKNSMSISAGQCQVSLQELQQRSFVGIECLCLAGLHAVQICLRFNMYRVSWRGESDNRPRTAEQLKSCIHQKYSTCTTATIDTFSCQTKHWKSFYWRLHF